MSSEELSPLVFTLWPSNNGSQFYAADYQASIPLYPDWLNSTTVDDVFGFGKEYDRRPPVFSRLPSPYNTVLNHTGEYIDSIYILATAANSSYMMCSLRGSMSVNCSTYFHASMSGGSLESRCEDPNDSMAYIKSRPNDTDGKASDWSRVASEAALAMALNDGISDANASSARMLTQLIPSTTSLDPLVPSIAETLAALMGSTLLLSALDTPFVHFWNYSTVVLPKAVQEGFNAQVQIQQYRSSYAQPWQCGFFIVLFGTFAISCYCLQYSVRHGKFLTDFTEPPNQFVLAMNSSPSQKLSQKHDGSPQEKVYKTKWYVGGDRGQHLCFENAIREYRSKEKDDHALDLAKG